MGEKLCYLQLWRFSFFLFVNFWILIPSPITGAAFNCYCSTASLTSAGKVAVVPIAGFFTSHAFTAKHNAATHQSHRHSIQCASPHFDPST